MATTYELIASTTVGSGGTTTIDFNSIPQTYTDLLLKISDRNNRSALNDAIGLNFNGSSSSYSGRRLYGDGSNATSDTESVYGIIDNATTSTSNTFANIEFYIPNYTSSNYKSISVDGVQENNATTAYSTLFTSLWSNTSAITSINIKLQNATLFLQYSTAYLYGIKNS